MNTMQEEFDVVVAHLYKQGRPAVKENGACAYRGINNTMCAVGCRIPDDVYEVDMDAEEFGMNVTSLILLYKTLPVELWEYIGMFKHLQEAHDCCVRNLNGTFHKASLKRDLKAVADAHNLTLTPPVREKVV